MPRIRITMEISSDLSDPEHEMGVTNDGFDALFEALSPYGDDINIEAA